MQCEVGLCVSLSKQGSVVFCVNDDVVIVQT